VAGAEVVEMNSHAGLIINGSLIYVPSGGEGGGGDGGDGGDGGG
jgi:hypothetical protein